MGEKQRIFCFHSSAIKTFMTFEISSPHDPFEKIKMSGQTKLQSYRSYDVSTFIKTHMIYSFHQMQFLTYF